MRQIRRSPTAERGRAVAPLVGVVLFVAIAVLLAGSIAVVFGSVSPAEPAPVAAFDLRVDADDSRIALEHVRGDPIDVDELTLTVTVDGEPLRYQPPVPFVGSSGFQGSPSGPLNAQSDGTWRPGERASLRLAGTNEPQIETGDEIAVTLAVDGRVIAELEATAA